MKRLVLLGVWIAATFAAACGGGHSTPIPPPPVGGFSNADLKGQYAFLMSGTDVAFFGRVGSFTADGNGNITGGVEDINSVGGIGTVTFAPSTYSVQANGRGTLTLTNSAGGTNPSRIFSITMISPSQGLIVQTDGFATASGTFNLQNSSAFTQASLSGGYIFDASGIDTTGNPDSIIGQFVSGGSGTLTSGVLDENDAANPSGPVAITSGTYQLDAVNGPTAGRGQINFAGLSYIFYVVDGAHIRMMETGSNALTLGDATAQGVVVAQDSQFTGSFVFLMQGSAPVGQLSRLGRFTSNGNGGLTQIAVDTNDQGHADRVPNGTLSAMTYSIGPNFPNSGRGTLTFTDSKLGKFEFIFYMSSAGRGVIQDNSLSNVADGFITAQTGGPFSNATLAGNYAFNWNGVSSNTSTFRTAEEDFVGQLKLTSASSSNATGLTDFSEFSSNDLFFLDIGLSGGLTINGDGTTATGSSNALELVTNNSPSATLDFASYVVNSSTILVASTASNRVTAGTIIRQSK